MIASRRKLIEVALPLDAINRAAAKEKSIRHGHPSTLHLWWARRPLAAARAVIFSQLVDDPSSVPEEFPTETDQQRERQRSVRTHRATGLVGEHDQRGRTADSCPVRRYSGVGVRTCADNADHSSGRRELFDPNRLPVFHDPFAGGGALTAWKPNGWGLEAHASDLNPVAVLINKAMIEIPTEVRGHAAGEPGGPGGDSQARCLARGLGSRGGRALLRQVDERRGAEADRTPVPERRSYRGHGGGTTRPRALRRPRSSR